MALIIPMICASRMRFLRRLGAIEILQIRLEFFFTVTFALDFKFKITVILSFVEFYHDDRNRVAYCGIQKSGTNTIRHIMAQLYTGSALNSSQPGRRLRHAFRF